MTQEQKDELWTMYLDVYSSYFEEDGYAPVSFPEFCKKYL